MKFADVGRNVADDVRASGEELLERATRVGKDVRQSADAAYEASTRAARQLRDSAEDAVKDTRRQIKANPFAAVAAAGVIGLAFGLVAGLLIASRNDD